MYPEEEKLYQIEMKVGLLEKDIQQTNQVYEKLSESIEKIQQMNDTMIRMITIHEQRHEHHAKAEENLKDDIKELHSRITTVSRELHERIDQVERLLPHRLRRSPFFRRAKRVEIDRDHLAINLLPPACIQVAAPHLKKHAGLKPARAHRKGRPRRRRWGRSW